MADPALDEALRERVRGHLAAFDRRPARLEGHRPAAVALALLDDEQGRACFVITRRAASLRAHGGQWALPGGRIDAGETAEQAALRELEEEVGLALPGEAVLGSLDDYPTRSGYVITPVVVWGGPGRQLSPSPEEVAAAYRVPLGELGGPEVPRVWSIPETDRPLIGVPLLDALIHAPTAAILYQLHEVALEGRTTRVAHYDQPVFAWR